VARRLAQVGKFYESVGSDAVLLMELANLNPMGNELRAGTPVSNLDVLLKQLVDAGFSVVSGIQLGT
jgi:DNA mismatch repair ATPase MutS